MFTPAALHGVRQRRLSAWRADCGAAVPTENFVRVPILRSDPVVPWRSGAVKTPEFSAGQDGGPTTVVEATEYWLGDDLLHRHLFPSPWHLRIPVEARLALTNGGP